MYNKSWYPVPQGPQNQSKSVKGLRLMATTVSNELQSIANKYEIPKNKCFLVGYSAGGVIALQMGLKAYGQNDPYGGVVMHSGAMLDMEAAPPYNVNLQSHLLITHSYNDTIFDFQERFVPMQEKLKHIQDVEYCFDKSGHGISNKQGLEGVKQISKWSNE